MVLVLMLKCVWLRQWPLYFDVKRAGGAQDGKCVADLGKSCLLPNKLSLAGPGASVEYLDVFQKSTPVTEHLPKVGAPTGAPWVPSRSP